MGGVDVILFTGGVGENQATARSGVCKTLGFLGVEIDLEKNKVRSKSYYLYREQQGYRLRYPYRRRVDDCNRHYGTTEEIILQAENTKLKSRITKTMVIRLFLISDRNHTPLPVNKKD